jgi:hypothetical protein
MGRRWWVVAVMTICDHPFERDLSAHGAMSALLGAHSKEAAQLDDDEHHQPEWRHSGIKQKMA